MEVWPSPVSNVLDRASNDAHVIYSEHAVESRAAKAWPAKVATAYQDTGK